MIDRWPSILWPNSILFHPEAQSRSGGLSITGYEQTVKSDAGRWRAKMTFDIGHGFGGKRTQDTVLAWRALLARCEGRVGRILIGPCDQANTPPAIRGDAAVPPETFDDGASFDDDTLIIPAATPAHIAGTYQSGATTIIVNMLGGHVPEPGQYFGAGNRLFLIKRAELYGGSLMAPFVPAYWQLKVWPPVREPIEDGSPADFDDPVCAMCFRSDDVGELMMQGMYYGTPSLDLVEAPPEP